MTDNQRPKEDGREKEPFLSRFSSWQAYLSFTAAVSGIVAVVAGGLVFLTIEPLGDIGFSVLIIGVALLMAAILFSPRQVFTALVGRRGRYGINALVMTVAFLGIGVLLNYFAFRELRDNRFDVTASRHFSLSPQSISILNDLDTSVRANAFFVPNDPRDTRIEQIRIQADDLLNEFTRRSDRFEYRFIDPQLDRSVAQQYDVMEYPVIIFENVDTGRLQEASSITEQEFVASILAVVGIKQKVVYYLEGHGERDMTDFTDGTNGFGFAARTIQGDNYRVLPLNILEVGDVPEDTAVLLIAGPKDDLLQEEIDPIYQYLRGGGRALMLLDPDTPQSFMNLIGKWGLALGVGSIVDQGKSVSGQPLTPLLASDQYADHPMTQVLEDFTFFPGVTSVDLAVEELPDTIVAAPLAATSSFSWLTQNLEDLSFDQNLSRPGPFFVAATVQATAPIGEEPIPSGQSGGMLQTSMVIIGDSDFATNSYFYAASNGDLLVNAVNWLAEDYNLISIRPKVFVSRIMTLDRNERNFLKWTGWFLMPSVITLMAGVVWWRRR